MKLREQTGVGMMDCKKALIETDGDFEEAVKYLREKGMASAAKKASRVAAEGLVACRISADNKTGIAVELNCETDFVAKSDPFVALIGRIADHLLVSDAKDVEAVLAEQIAGSSQTLTEVLGEATASIGEKLSLRRFAKFVLNGDGIVSSYIHMGGKIGVLVELASDSSDKEALKELAYNLAMQVAAAKPLVVGIADVDQAALEIEKEILTAQAKNEGRPENIIAKMVEGRIAKYYKEVCLLEQEYVRDGSLSVKKVVAQTEEKLGAKIAVNRFVRFEMGEGLEKRVDNFADEINEQLKAIG
jgi:elongation factor Ts